MEDAQRPFVVGVRFSKVGKVYHFEASQYRDLTIGDAVVVETSRGWQLGEIAQIVSEPELPQEGGWKSIDRKATPRDLLLRQTWQLREADVVAACKKRARELNIYGLKIVGAEFSFDGMRLSIMFSSESEEKVELKSLRQDMQRQFPGSQVELRQIGPRDVAKIIGGMGACGLETRCCSKYLTDFSSISIRMAKEQGISLTPTEITGMCGRLRCCLIYEYDVYVEARQSMPKRNKRFKSPLGDGKVVDIVPLQRRVRLEIPDVGVREFPLDQLIPLDENNQPIAQAAPVEKPEIEEAKPIEEKRHPAPELGKGQSSSDESEQRAKQYSRSPKRRKRGGGPKRS